MYVICSVLLMVNVGGVLIQSREDVEGKVLKDDPKETKYLLDFTEGVKRFQGVTGSYEKVLVDKADCVKE